MKTIGIRCSKSERQGLVYYHLKMRKIYDPAASFPNRNVDFQGLKFGAIKINIKHKKTGDQELY